MDQDKMDGSLLNDTYDTDASLLLNGTNAGLLNDTDETFEDVAIWLRSIHGVVMSLLLLASVAGNSLVLILVLHNKSLQHRSVLCSLGLVVADMLIAVVWSVQSLGNVGLDYCPFGRIGCSILGVLTSIGLYARWCIVALITIERFFSIVCPFCYLKWSKGLLIVLSIFCWVVPIVSTTIPWLAGLGTYMFRLQYSTCIITCSSSDVVCFRFYLGLFGIYVGVGGVLPMLLYFSMCVIGQRKAYKMNHIELGTVEKQANSSVRENGVEENSNRCSRQNSDSSNRRNSSRIRALDKKILRTFFLIFMNVFLTQLPIYVTSALRSRKEIFDEIPEYVHFIFTYIYLLGPVLDPLLIMRNKDFGEAFKKLLRRRAANAQGSNVTQALMDFVKLSSLIDVTPETVRRMRRNSCPSVTLRKVLPVPVQPIVKARSFDGCVSWDKEGNPVIAPGQPLTKVRRTQERKMKRNRAPSKI